MNDRKIKACEMGSGISWDRWLAILTPHSDASHTEIARVALAAIEAEGESSSPQWWAQSCAVTFEQAIGVRQVGQTYDGSFSVTVSRTLAGDMDEALSTWQTMTAGREDFAGTVIVGEPRVSSTEKWRYWRCDLDDGSKVSVNIQTKPAGDKSTLAVNHDKLASAADVEVWRAFWKSFPQK